MAMHMKLFVEEEIAQLCDLRCFFTIETSCLPVPRAEDTGRLLTETKDFFHFTASWTPFLGRIASMTI
jgi:hypothetical protein